MLLRPRADVFQVSVPLLEIMRFCKLITSGRHGWAVTPSQLEAFEAYVDSSLSSGPAETQKLLARDAFTQTAYIPVATAITDIELDGLALILNDLERAAVLVVEDLMSDGAFIGSLTRIFDKRELVAAFENGWIEVRHGGGSGRVSAVARADRSRFHYLVRVFALFDSDRLTPTAPASCESAATAALEQGVRVHVFEMREAENYLPNRVLASALQRPTRTPAVLSRRLDALKRLSPEQRAHYDMKNGFGLRNGRVDVHPAQIELYASVSDLDKKRLIGGFGETVLDRLRTMERSVTREDFASLGSGVAIEIDALLHSISAVV